MYRAYPKKQDHGTRGQKKHFKRRNDWRWFDSYYKARVAQGRKRFEKRVKAELNKLAIDCTDEDIERFEVRAFYINGTDDYDWWD